MLAEEASFKASMMARVLEAGRSGYHEWKASEKSQVDDPWADLKEHILEIYETGRRRFGYRKIWAVPGDEEDGRSDHVSKYRVQKCMRELGTGGIAPNAKKQTTIPDKDAPKRPDLLKRDFEAPVPTTRLVGDITYPDTLNGGCSYK